MANSGIIWVDQIFNLAVRWLYSWAEFLGITYEEINVWIFCILWPILTLVLMGWVASLIKDNRQLQKQLIP